MAEERRAKEAADREERMTMARDAREERMAMARDAREERMAMAHDANERERRLMQLLSGQQFELTVLRNHLLRSVSDDEFRQIISALGQQSSGEEIIERLLREIPGFSSVIFLLLFLILRPPLDSDPDHEINKKKE
jgi:hypothetical protein